MRDDITAVLERLEKQSKLEKSKKVDIPPEDRMLAITWETGEQIVKILQDLDVYSVLEVGTSVGYSTIWCAKAIAKNNGEIITIEQNPDKIIRAKKNFRAAKVSKYITVKEGTASEILSELGSQSKYNEYFGFALIDADKENVMEYFDAIYPMIMPGGVILTDNMLYPKKYRRHMKAYSNYIRKNYDATTMTLLVGNGVELTIKYGYLDGPGSVWD